MNGKKIILKERYILDCGDIFVWFKCNAPSTKIYEYEMIVSMGDLRKFEDCVYDNNYKGAMNIARDCNAKVVKGRKITLVAR